MPIYMKYEGIDGPVTGRYKGWIELESCQFGPHQGGAAAISEIVVTKFQDSASSHLFNEAFNGKGKKVTVDFVKGDEAPYVSLELENTIVSSYSVSGGGSRPMESLSLNYAKVTYSTKPTASSKDAKDKLTWDLATAP